MTKRPFLPQTPLHEPPDGHWIGLARRVRAAHREQVHGHRLRRPGGQAAADGRDQRRGRDARPHRRAPELAAPPVSPACRCPWRRAERLRVSPGTLEFRSARDLKAFADGLNARRATLTGDERYNLAKALEECQFTTTINEDIAAYSAKQRRQFLAGLTPGDLNNTKRVAAYDAADNTQRCLRFQGTRISQKDIDDLYAAAAMQGDPRAQARILVAELNAKASTNRTERGRHGRR